MSIFIDASFFWGDFGEVAGVVGGCWVLLGVVVSRGLLLSAAFGF